jgi:hypothetical protein
MPCKCRCKIEEIPEAPHDLMIYLDAQRLARNQVVPGEPSFCRGCAHLVVLVDRITELDRLLLEARS